jgi:two-component sensor histidine kinase
VDPIDRPAPESFVGEDAESIEALRYLEQFENLILTLSGRFVNLKSGDLDLEINAALQAIGEFARVDRSYVFQFSADCRRFTNTHEWCAEGVEPMIDRLQDAPADKFGWALQHFLDGEELYVADVAEMPPEASEVMQELQIQGIRSMVNVPLICDERVMGFVGFDALRFPKAWTGKHRNLLKVVGEIIAGAIERERATAALSRQLELEQLIADISTHFINVPILRLEEGIDEAIRRIGEFTGVDRSYVFGLSSDGRHMSNTHEWCANGVKSFLARLQGLPVGDFSFSMSWLKKGLVFHVPDVSQLPPEARCERREFESERIRSLVSVPIMARQTMIGFLGFDAVRARKLWTEDDIRLLKLAAEIIANALDRKAVEERLQASLDDKDVLLREIHHRVKNNMQVVSSLLYLQEHAVRDRIGDVALDAFQQSRARIKAMAAIHDRLYRSSSFTSIDFDEYLNALIPELLRSYRVTETVAVEISARGVELGIDAAVPCALIINELFTNCLKHAFPHDRPGKIAVTMRRTANKGVELTVADDGIGFPGDQGLQAPQTLGLRLVVDLAKQLDGAARLVEARGARIVVAFSRLR